MSNSPPNRGRPAGLALEEFPRIQAQVRLVLLHLQVGVHVLKRDQSVGIGARPERPASRPFEHEMVGDFPGLAPVEVGADLADQHHHDGLLLAALGRDASLDRAEFVELRLLFLGVEKHARGERQRPGAEQRVPADAERRCSSQESLLESRHFPGLLVPNIARLYVRTSRVDLLPAMQPHKLASRETVIFLS